MALVEINPLNSLQNPHAPLGGAATIIHFIMDHNVPRGCTAAVYAYDNQGIRHKRADLHLVGQYIGPSFVGCPWEVVLTYLAVPVSKFYIAVAGNSQVVIRKRLLPPSPLRPVTPNPGAPIFSAPNTTPTYITFFNETRYPVKISSLNQHGQSMGMGLVYRGEMVEYRSYVGQVWTVVREHEVQPFALYFASPSETGLATIR
ncbi:hypothetical protein H0H93_008467 [Arthromyces matolae]|nr:hypothetical protein H0H93_008467 [Arthromyces matolae]